MAAKQQQQPLKGPGECHIRELQQQRQHATHTLAHTLHLSASIHTFGPLCSTSYNNKQQQDICCPKRQNAAEASPGCRLAAAPLFLLHCMLSPVTMLPNKIFSTKLRLQLLDFFEHTMQTLFLCVEPVKSCTNRKLHSIYLSLSRLTPNQIRGKFKNVKSATRAFKIVRNCNELYFRAEGLQSARGGERQGKGVSSQKKRIYNQIGVTLI